MARNQEKANVRRCILVVSLCSSRFWSVHSSLVFI
jgi:hypothetical protein